MEPNYTTPLISRRSSPKGVSKLYDEDTPLDNSWRQQALCRGKDISIFFPSASEPRTIKSVTSALQHCYYCPVSHHCLYEAIKYNYDGVWGNTIYKQRIHFIRTQLDNDVQNLTLDKAKEFVQTSKIETYPLLHAPNISIRKRRRIKYKEQSQ